MTGLRTALVLMAAVAAGGPATAARAADWDPVQVVVSSGGDNATLGVSGRPAVADASGRVCAVFQNNLGGDNFQVLFNEQEEDGTWSLPQVISGTAKARNANLAVDHEGRLHVVWEDITNGEGEGEITHRVREADGTWDAPEFLFPASGFSRHAAVTVDAMDRIQVVWEDGRLGVQRLLHAVAPAGGEWSGPHALSQGGIYPENPSLAADGLGGVHVVWTDRSTVEARTISYDVLYSHIEDPNDLPAPIRLVDHAASARHPCIEATADGTVHLVWLDDRASGNLDYFEVYYKRYLPGIGWGKDKRFTYNQVEHGNPVLLAGPGNTVNVAWEDFRTGSPDIYFRQITDARGWDRDPTPITADVSSSQSPALALAPGGRLTLIWSDAQGAGTFQVFAKDGTTTAAP